MLASIDFELDPCESVVISYVIFVHMTDIILDRNTRPTWPMNDELRFDSVSGMKIMSSRSDQTYDNHRETS